MATAVSENSHDEANMLLPTVIDSRARLEPERVFCYLTNRNAEGGFTVNPVTYYDYSNAINKCAWWMEENLGKGLDLDTVGYFGPPDLRYTIVAFAAAKTNRKILLMSTRNSVEGQLKLIDSINCKILLTAQDFPAINPLASLLSAQRNLRVIPFERMEYWIGQPKSPDYPFLATLQNEPNRAFAILHTSGSTGLPEPVIYTFGALATYRTWLDPDKIIPGAPRNTVDIWKNKRHYVAFPTSHMTGMLAVTALNVYWNMVPILGPATVLPTPEFVASMHKLDICEASLLPPSLLEAVAKVPEYLEGLRKLDHVIWCGSAFSSSMISNKISSVVPIYAAYGSTEAGPLPLVVEDQQDHEYMTFSPLVGAQFRHRAEDLYELVIVRDSRLSACQKVFFIFPNLTEWLTKDLMSKHPTKENMWRYRGRTDDIIVLLSGVNINPLEMEGIVMHHPKVAAALLTGTSKPEAAWLIEVTQPPKNAEERASLVDELWPTIEKANSVALSNVGKVSRDKIVFTTTEKAMLRAGKGSVQRKLTLIAFQSELDALYE